MNTNINWFEDWFDSPFYHTLYKSRNNEEAENFIDNLITFFKPSANQSFIDIGCGKGRHSIYLNKKGFNVTGIDLSANSIVVAKKNSSTSLHFFVHDMRNLFRVNEFDYALNLFTSFGYFENEQNNYDAIKAMANNLKSQGILVLDFMNAKKVIENIVTEETKIVDGITFEIRREVTNNFIVKTISFLYEGKKHSFQEKVQALTLTHFEKYFEANQLKIVHLRGNYKLDEFNENTSDRLIIIAKKTE